MSISTVSATGEKPVLEHLRELNERGERSVQAVPALSQLSKIADTASLSTLVPKLQNILQAIDNPDNNVFQAVSANISHLQDAFVEAVSHILAADNIDLSHKITLRLNQAGELSPAGEHPEKERIEAALAKAPELSSAFREIASQSELRRDVANISRVIGAQTGLAGYQSDSGPPRGSAYQISLKGEMSHFYFNKS